MTSISRQAIRVCAIVAIGLSALVTTATAQSTRRTERDSPSPDFFLGSPKGWLSVRGGVLRPRSDSDLYRFVTDQLTVNPSDFRSRSFGSEVGIVLTPRFAVESSVDVSRRSVGSEYRRFIASNGQPIAQKTTLDQTGLSLGFRFNPTAYGRRVSRYAFIPTRFAPYAGAGLSSNYYRFAQTGQFVDFVDLRVFGDSFVSNGWAFGPYVRGGTEVQVWRRLYVNVDARYTWQRSDLSADFTGFDGIDLTGFRGTTGFSVVF
jgi:hypothetical protein